MTRLAVLWVAGLLAIGLAGCSGAGDGIATAGGAAAAPSSSAPPADDEARARQFAACMREHGVNLPDPEPGGGPVKLDDSIDPAKLREAHKACEKFAPGAGGEGGKLDAQQLEQLRKLAACMRDHGVKDFPDPNPEGGLVVERGTGPNPNDPTFQAAEKACRQYAPDATREEGGGPR